MKSSLGKFIGYTPKTDDINWLKEEWKTHSRRAVKYAVGLVPLSLIPFPFSEIALATLGYLVIREAMKLTYLRYRGQDLGYDLNEIKIGESFQEKVVAEVRRIISNAKFDSHPKHIILDNT